MSNYFSYFPTTQNDLSNSGNFKTVTNIFRRFKVKPSVKDRAEVYYEYDIQAGDRPDTIAEKYYGDSAYAWIVLQFNDIVDPIFDWVLFDNQFDDYIKGKYGSIPAAQAEVHEYRWNLSEQKTKTDGTLIPKKYVVVDKDTYDTIAEDKKTAVSKLDWEIEENEKKRTIRILDKKYLTQVLDEVENILRNNS